MPVGMRMGWEPTREAAMARLHAIDPERYARTRNHLHGAVTGLSPYLTHGLLDLAATVDHVRTTHDLPMSHKLVMELGWRAFFRHVWQHAGEGILHAMHDGVLPESAYAAEVPPDVREARTGLAVIDQAVLCLYQYGYVHNHARMWLASYVVHQRKVHWRAGADWMVAHLLDGDLGSNHLSWQWVAGTASSKPYLFNAENVARYADDSWHVGGTALDTDYDSLDAWARNPRKVMVGAPGAGAVAHAASGLFATTNATPEPARFATPPPAIVAALKLNVVSPLAAAVAGRDVQLVHPWSLGVDARAQAQLGRTVVAVLDSDFHTPWPWSQGRWQFVLQRYQALHAEGALLWWGSASETLAALAAAASVHGHFDEHLGSPWRSLGLMEARSPFGQPTHRQRSFSAWWHAAAKAQARARTV
jgi:deoxyribodipyrimidine photo-lyase